MPITPSHAVVALPFVRTPLVPAAIAVGAMAPDLPLFVRGLLLNYALTHSLVWLPATVLLALALLLIWRCALRPAVRELSPTWLARRLPPEWDAAAGSALRETFGSARGILLLVLSLTIGALSHIVWDSFTHEGRWGTAALPLLDEQWGVFPGYRWLQHGSSVVGALILAIYALLWLRRRDVAVSPHRMLPGWVRAAWWVSLPVLLLVGWGVGLAAYGPLDSGWTAQHLAYRILPPVCAAWGLSTLALALVIQVRRPTRPGCRTDLPRRSPGT